MNANALVEKYQLPSIPHFSDFLYVVLYVSFTWNTKYVVEQAEKDIL